MGGSSSDGPEAGLHERATAPEVCAYYARVLRERMLGSGRVSFYPNCDYVGDGRFVSRLSGKSYEVRVRRRVVDARYLSPEIPAETPAPFGVADGVHVVAVNDLVKLGGAPSQYVIVGSGKTATDACIWLLDNGVDPSAICWVRPRDPWMLNRAVVQPDPAVFIGMAADTMQAAAEAASPDDMFLPLGGRGGDAAHRPVRDTHHGEDPDAGTVGARPVDARSIRSSGSGTSSTWSRPGWCSATARWRPRRTL